MINVGQENVPPGKTWYWAGANQPERDVVAFRESVEALLLPKAQAAVSLEHGLDERTSVGAIARAMLVGDERVTFVEGSVRRSIGPALVEVAGGWESGGGRAARAQFAAKFGKVNVNGEAVVASNFHLDGQPRRSVKDFRLSADAPITIGRTFVAAHSDVRLTKHSNSSSQLEAAARLSTTLRRFNLATDLRYRRQFCQRTFAPGQMEVSLIGSGGDRKRAPARVQHHGGGAGGALPRCGAQRLLVRKRTVDWEGALAYEAGAKRARARISHVRRLNTMALSVTGEAATDGSVAVGFNLNFSLDPGSRIEPVASTACGCGRSAGAGLSRSQRQWCSRSVGALRKGRPVTTGTRVSAKPTDDRGTVLVGGLATSRLWRSESTPAASTIPIWCPGRRFRWSCLALACLQRWKSAWSAAGEIEGAVVKSGGIWVRRPDARAHRRSRQGRGDHPDRL